jgi:hypothetical protein
MGTGADYTEYATGQFAINVHDVLPISITNLQAIGKFFRQNMPQPAAGTNIFSTNIVPSNPPADFRVQVCMSNAGTFSAVITHAGVSQVMLLNGGVALVADVLYTFDVLVYPIFSPGDGINFRYSSTGGIIRSIQVQEIDASTY